MFKSIPNPSFLSKIKIDSVGLWFYRISKNWWILTLAFSNRPVAMTMQWTLSCHTMFQNEGTVFCLGPTTCVQWTWYQTQTLSGALTLTVNLCFVYWGFIFIFIDLVKNTVLRTCKFMDDDLINICYQLPYCTPMNIPFHESSQQWISQKYSIQCILIKPQYGKYFYPTL